MFKQKRKRGSIRRFRMFLLAALVIAAGVLTALRLNYQQDDLRLVYYAYDASVHAVHIDDEGDEVLEGDTRRPSEPSSDSYSPDGQWLAWFSSDTPVLELRLTHITTSKTEVIASITSASPRTVWSSDSRYLVYDDMDFMLLDTETGILEQLTDSGWESSPSFSPDSTQIVYLSSSDGDFYYIYIMDLATGESRQVTSEPFALNPVWSPDGKWIAFMRYYLEDTGAFSGAADIFIVAPDGKNLRRLTWNPGWNEIIGWEQ